MSPKNLPPLPRTLVLRALTRLALYVDPSFDPQGCLGRLEIHHVDDPLGQMRLIRVAGPVDPASIGDLFETWDALEAPYAIHLDLADAEIADADTMRRLEGALDHLERQQIAVRLVGVDPHHPCLQT